VPFNIFRISSIRCWFSSLVRVDARMEKHWRTRAAVSSMDCYILVLKGLRGALWFAFLVGRLRRWLVIRG
jgi:hypothetical protein